jgi:type II secretory pathway pseudopilin PulG
LAAIALPQYQWAVEKSRAAEAYQMGKAIKNAMDIYYLTRGEGPVSFDQLDIDIKGERITQKTIKNKNFTYNLNYAEQEKKSDAVHIIRYINDIRHYDVIFTTNYFPDGFKIYCDAFNALGEKICVSLGGTFLTGIHGPQRYAL